MATTLAAYVRAPAADREFCAECEATATALVDARTAGVTLPDEVRDAAILEVGANLYQRRAARSDVANFADGSGLAAAPALPALDPLKPASGILAPYLIPGLA